MSLRMNIVGTGKLGKTLAHLFVKNKAMKINGIFNRNLKRSENALQFIGEGTIYKSIQELPSADWTFITTADDAIADSALQLCRNPHIQAGHIVLHCSGLLSSDILTPLKERGCYIASIHPMHSFANPQISLLQFAGSFCALEGDKEALGPISKAFSAIGAVPYLLLKEKKALYHAAGVFASNYLITLAKEALVCLQEVGIEKPMARSMVLQLMKGSLLNLEKTQSPEEALTGPIQRGDSKTLEAHLQALEDKALQKELYKALGKATLALTQHGDQKQSDLGDLFT